MISVKGYISSNFTRSFLMIFLPFFFIISLIYLVKISALTAQIQISFGELLSLYSYSIPDIIFYTLPLSFVSALANVLLRLLQDNELIALYALGLKAKDVLKSLLMLGFLFSTLLLTISILAMPLSKQLYKSFKKEKKSQAKLNIVAGKLGQKFGNYYIYVKRTKKGVFKNLVIYNRSDKNSEQFFSSKEGELKNENQVVSLLLKDGYGYTYAHEKLRQIQYKSLEVFDALQSKAYKFETIGEYWSQIYTNKKIFHRLLFFIFVSLIPLLSVYIVASFTMINPRYQANRSFLVIFTTTFTLYMIASSLEKWGTQYLLILSTILVWIVGQWLFDRRVSRYF